MSKVNFTIEHQNKLTALAMDALYRGQEFKAKLGTTMTIYDLFHNCSLNTLTVLHGATKKQVTDISNMDEWSLTEHQQKKQKALEKEAELLNLLIGYTRHKAEVASDKAKLAELKATYANLKESAKTPEEKLKEIEAQIGALETVA